MRTPTLRVVALTAFIALTACSSGSRVIVVRQPAPPPPPPPPRIQPLEITVARPIRGQLLVQTNRPSYVALFEIVPERGVALLAPTYAHQRTWMLAGLNWIPVSWKLQSTMYYGPPSGTAVPGRWVYAIASDVPLRLPDEAFNATYMRRVLGPAAYRATNPYLTMRAIARAFVPTVIEEAWAEDAYALAATYTSDPYRTVRIYCANRTVYEVPEELADRAWCPVRVPQGGTIVRSTPVRPDSIVVGTGPRTRRRLPEMIPVRPPIDRVQEPSRPADAPVVIEDAPRQDAPKVVNEKDVRENGKEKRGNAYGHTDDPNVKGRGIENEKREEPRRNEPRREPRADPPVVAQPEPQPPTTDVKGEKREEKQEQKQEQEQNREDKQEPKQEQKQEAREQKADENEKGKQEAKQEEKQEPKQEPPKNEPKQEPKEEQKQDEKQNDKQEAKQEQKQEAKEAKEAKPDEKPGKPDNESPIKKALKHKP